MKRNTINIAFTENGINILDKKKIIKEELLSVDNYKVINRILFIEEVTKIFNNHKINNSILTNNINIIVDRSISSLDRLNIESIFKDLSFNRINIINIEEIFNIKETELIINISQKSIKIYSSYKTYSINIYFKEYKKILKLYLKNILSLHNIKTIKIYGNLNNIKEYCNYIEKTSKLDTYIYADNDTIPLCYII